MPSAGFLRAFFVWRQQGFEDCRVLFNCLVDVRIGRSFRGRSW